MNPNTITFIQSTSEERISQTLQGLNLISPYVDRCVIVSPKVDAALIANAEIIVTGDKVEWFEREWHDNLPEYLNHALAEVREGWVLRFDPDEYPNEVFLKSLRTIVRESGNGLKYNWVKLNCHDVVDGGPEQRMDYYRAVFFKWYPSLKYEGVGIGVDHEQLVGAPFIPRKLTDDCWYVHERTTLEMRTGNWRRFHVAGGGNALGSENPMWPEYCKLLVELFPNLVESSPTEQKVPWQKFLPVIKHGNLPEPLKDWLNKNRNRNVIPDADQELREAWELYFVLLHPNENVDKLAQKPDQPPPDTENYRFIEDAYIRVLGRHADTDGKKAYAQLIKDGKLRKEDLERALMASPEYQQLVTA